MVVVVVVVVVVMVVVVFWLSILIGCGISNEYSGFLTRSASVKFSKEMLAAPV